MINGMFFQRGSAGDYDNWAKLGNPGWGWTDLLPYFKKVGPSLQIQVWRWMPFFALRWLPVTHAELDETEQIISSTCIYMSIG